MKSNVQRYKSVQFAPVKKNNHASARFKEMNLENVLQSEGIEISARYSGDFSEILTIDALKFVAKLSRQFGGRREALLHRRQKVQERIDAGVYPTFLAETENIRKADWLIAPVPSDIQDRRVEITGPAGDVKMVINALNSRANVYMADFEDAQSPTWENTIRGQINLRNAIRGHLSYVSPEGKRYTLNENVATLFVRPRGWHLVEKHVLIDGKPVSASILDFALFFFHNAKPLIEKGTGPYFYLPKMENHLEARLWNDIFNFAQDELGIERKTIKATVLIETILAAFEMDEILHELKDHSAGLNCGRWDYIFSMIKKFRMHSRFVLPDRPEITMDKAFLSSYVKLLIQTCHRRGAHAMGGMSAYIPSKSDENANVNALARVREDKEREVAAGHDGTWVAHPGLVQLAREIFDQKMPQANQISVIDLEAAVSPDELLSTPSGAITEAGVRVNIDVGIRYIEAWLRGIGAVPLYNLMEDAATAEISRAQLWQWVRHAVTLSDGTTLTLERVRGMIREELSKIQSTVGQDQFKEGQFHVASELFDDLISSKDFIDFLTLPAYDHLS